MAYDAKKAMERIEGELIDSMMRNLKRHLAEEDAEGFDWSQWQVEQLKALEQLRRSNPRRYDKRFADINARIRKAIAEAEAKGQKEEELRILRALAEGGANGRFMNRPYASPTQTSVGAVHERLTDNIHIKSAEDTFFRTNEGKLDALLDATEHDLKKAEHAVLRRTNDQYRKIIFDAQMYANTGAGTVEKAVDMATKDFVAKGIDSIVYKNGSRHTISDYADMCIRTAERRAYLMGAGQKRQEWGVSLVIVNRRGTMKGGDFGHACPHCIPWLGQVLVDDVYSGGKPDGVHKLLSEAMAAGFLHPRCKDGFTTYFPGISSVPDPATKDEVKEAVQAEQKENRETYAERQAEKYGRLAEYSLDPENQRRYQARAVEWRAELLSQVGRKAAELGVKVDYSGFHPKLAEAVNQSIADVQEMFGRIPTLKGVIEETEATDAYARFDKINGVILLKNVGDPVIMEKMKEAAEYQHQMGGWSTGDARHTIVHELGHALGQQYLTPAKRAELEKLRRAELLRVTGDADTDLMEARKTQTELLDRWGEKARDNLSLYGLTSVDEMISESVAQNILGDPGVLAQQVILILMG